MTTIHLTKKQILTAVSILWLLFVSLRVVEDTHFSTILNVVGFSFLVFVPGFLTLGILRQKYSTLSAGVFVAVGISLIEIIGVGLFTNTFLPLAGVTRPLEPAPLAYVFSSMLIVLAFLYYRCATEITIPIARIKTFGTLPNVFFAFVPIIFVVLSSWGALHLNAGGSGTITLTSLLGVAVYAILLVKYKGRLDANVVPIALFFISLALLLMTSLRSEFIIGHDIQREFDVFQLTKEYGFWSIAFYHDAYNACLSITILPAIMSALLRIPDPYIFKLLFQIIFAVVPGVLFLLVSRFVSRRIAFLSVLFFVSFPTFYTDMPFLVRQEIAFTFLALMFLTLFRNTKAKKKVAVIIPILFGLGVVLSHYSTTYTVVVLLAFTYVFQRALLRYRDRLAKVKTLQQSGVYELTGAYVQSSKRIPISLVITLMIASIMWSSVITDTSSGSLARVARNTVSAIQFAALRGIHSGDLEYNLFSFKSTDPKNAFDEYKKYVVDNARATAPLGTYYDSTTGQYPTSIVSRELIPLTSVGRWLEQNGVDVHAFHYGFKQTLAKIIQVLIVVGFIGVLLSTRYLRRPVDAEFVLLAAGNFVMVALIVVLPVLSVEYGVLRAFQQSLMFLGFFVGIGAPTVCRKFTEKTAINTLLGLSVLFFLSSTGVFTQFLGGYESPLHLNNNGLYYDLYYLRAGEVEGLTWLAEQTEGLPADVQSESQIDPHVFTGIRSITDANQWNTIYPDLIRKDSYVFLNYANVHKKQSTVVYNDTFITYEYPIEFLQSVKKLVYDNGVVQIYR